MQENKIVNKNHMLSISEMPPLLRESLNRLRPSAKRKTIENTDQVNLKKSKIIDDDGLGTTEDGTMCLECNRNKAVAFEALKGSYYCFYHKCKKCPTRAKSRESLCTSHAPRCMRDGCMIEPRRNTDSNDVFHCKKHGSKPHCAFRYEKGEICPMKVKHGEYICETHMYTLREHMPPQIPQRVKSDWFDKDTITTRSK